MIPNVHRLLVQSTALLLIGTAPAVATPADPASPQAKAGTVEGGDIVVTAQHREERLDKVGITIDAFDGNRLREEGATSVRDLTMYTPNLAVHLPFGENSYPSITLRGMSADNFNESAPQTTGVYVDGIYQSSSPMLAFQMFDQERVEVLKGPQGTLYGRNTTAGAVNFISRQPNFTPNGYAQIDFGRYNYLNVEAAIGGPLVGDTLAGRIATKVVRQWDGPQTDRSGGDHYGQIRTAFFRGSLLFTDNDGLRITVTGHGGVDRSDTWPFTSVAALVPAGQPNAGQICPQFLAGDIAGANANCVDVSGYHKQTKSVYDNPRSLYGRHDNSTYGVVGQIDYSFGAVRLTSVTGYDHLKRREGLDEDGGANVVTDTIRGSTVDQFSQELRLASDDDGAALTWIAGAYYSWDRLTGNPIFSSDFRDWFGGAVADYSKLSTRTGAIFGQLDYRLTPTLKLTGGLRQTWVGRDFTYRSVFTPTGGTGATTFAGSNKLNQSDWSGRIALDYTPSDQVLIYANISRGFDAGTFNSYFLGSQAALQPTRQERVTAYELGIKASVAPGVRIEAAAFYNRWTDIIVTAIENRTGVNAPYLTNGKGADIAGGELKLALRPVRRLSIDAGASYTYQKLDTLRQQNLFGTIVDLAGGRLANSPEWTLNGSARYAAPVGRYTVTPSIDVKYESRSQRDLLNTKILQTPPHALLNARLMIEDGAGWQGSLWVRNLTDIRYVAEAYQVVSGGYAGLVYNLPRTYGISLSRSF
ncbi:TonB-dependent receptor [Sphingomonas sp. MMSM20]|uniref:TonB-dependent receptor n=1 Tax=Sphingomonas lycopersici TaxID=2951807 RepID=UPI0022383ADC|nr:TonB-dependent receptor [Sphingomonas lycopersici]MCW6529961.1 TonB-dependent receptor [Sphingomonas lycopersici]